MSNNRTFFKNVKQGNMTLGDIFSDMARRHTTKETGEVLIAGTPSTTPKEADMLANWRKPFLFARFFVGFLAMLLFSYVMAAFLGYMGGYYLLLVGIPFLMPVTLLLMIFEMNVPRNISLYEVITTVGLGGILSLIATLIMDHFIGVEQAYWAGLVEEPAKLIVIYMVLRKNNYKYAINGALIGAAVGTGFAVMESLIYTINYIAVGTASALIGFAENGMNIVDAINNIDSIWGAGIAQGLYVALARAVTALSGHGVFAALYGCALVKAKGSEEVNVSHLLKGEFLLYFAVAIGLHALHNYGLDLGLPVLFGGLLPCEYLIIAAIAVILLVNTLRIGVNQVVEVSAARNGGRVTMAVNRGAGMGSAPIGGAREIQLQCIAGPVVGQTFSCHEGQSLTMGRVAGRADIALPGCESVSGVHCRVDVMGGRLNVTDLNSTNGTYLDNQRLSPNQPMHALDGSTIYLGNKNCAFRVQIR